MNSFDLNVLTLEKEIYSGKAVSLIATALDGEICILAHHAPLVSALGKGKLKIKLEGGEMKEFETERGFIQTQKNKVNVFISIK